MHLRLLGRFQLLAGPGAEIDVPGARVQLLLARLALPVGERLDRGVLCAAFWGDRAEAQARASLRQAVWTLHRALEGHPDPLIAEGADLRLDPAVITTDVAEFDRPAGTSSQREQALALYRGDLLQGLDLAALAPDGFFDSERARLREAALALAAGLAAEFGRDGRFDQALAAARRGLALDPYREDLHRLLMDQFRRAGRHREAREQFETCRRLLADDLGIAPEAATVQAFQSLAEPTPPAPRPVRPRPAPAVEVAPPRPAPAAEVAAPVPRWRWKWPAAGVAVALAVGLGLVAASPGYRSRAALPDTAGVPSIVVLPFRDISVGGQQPEQAAALTADLVTDLSRVSGIFVLSQQPDAADAGTDPAVVARGLGVEYAVAGTVRQSRGLIRTTAFLVEAATGRHLWAENFDRKAAEHFQVQDQVIRAIVAALEVELKAAEVAAIERIPTANLEAWDQYMRAEVQGHDPTESAMVRRALDGYTRAIELDPGFAEAHAGYARAVVEVWRRGFTDIMPSAVARQEAYEAAGRALALDPGNARAHMVLSRIQASEGARDSALVSARRAVAVQPGNSEAHANLGLMLAFSGDSAQATTEVALARRLDPALPPDLLMVSGQVAFADGRYADAIADLSAVRGLLPASELVLEHLAAAQAQSGLTSDARATLDKLLAIFPIASLELYDRVYGATRGEAWNARLLEGLRRAGLPRWPYGYQGRADDRVTGDELQTVATARSWAGQLGDGSPFLQETGPGDSFAYRSAVSLVTGRQNVRGDHLCQVVERYLVSGEICGEVYRAGIDAEGRQLYELLTFDGVKRFVIGG